MNDWFDYLYIFSNLPIDLNYSSQGLGYDHNYILRGSVAYDVPAGLQPVAKAASWKLGELVKPEKLLMADILHHLECC